MNIVSAGQLLVSALATPKSIIFGAALAIHLGDENVGGFQIAMDDGFLMRVLDAFADLHEELQPFARAEPVIVAVVRDRNTGDVLHDKVRRALGRRAGVEHFGDRGVVHQGQSLALGFEARNDFAGVHPGLDQLKSDTAANGFLLLGQPDLTHSAFSDFLQQAISADDRPAGLSG